jgi:hypothetical protein
MNGHSSFAGSKTGQDSCISSFRDAASEMGNFRFIDAQVTYFEDDKMLSMKLSVPDLQTQ